MVNDKSRALEVIEFMQLLHLTDDFYGQPFTLMKWQHDLSGTSMGQSIAMGIGNTGMLIWRFRRRIPRQQQ